MEIIIYCEKCEAELQVTGSTIDGGDFMLWVAPCKECAAQQTQADNASR